MEALNIDSSSSLINSSAANNTATTKANDELTQSDFIELLVAQIKNQDPTEPMDASEFMTQLTQSSAVNGLNELQKSFDLLATKLTSDQSLQAAGLVGKSVLLPDEGLLTSGGSINGQLNLERTASDVKINIFNTHGELVKSMPLGGHNAGAVQFKWDGIGDGGTVVPEGEYLVTAEALIDGDQQAIEVSLETRIDSISLNKNIDGTQAGTLLNLSSGQSVTLGEIQEIK